MAAKKFHELSLHIPRMARGYVCHRVRVTHDRNPAKMRKEAFSTVFTGRTSNEAEAISRELRSIGLHPAELALTASISTPGLKAKFPVEVPCGESEKAIEFLNRMHSTTAQARG